MCGFESRGADSLVTGRPCVEHVGLQLGEESLLVLSLTDLHVQQVRVQGGVVNLHDSHLDGSLCGGGVINGCIIIAFSLINGLSFSRRK